MTRGRRRERRWRGVGGVGCALAGAVLVAGVGLGAAGCGYHAVYGGDAERFRVVLVRSLVPDAVASDEVLSGVREELARAGALMGGEGYPRIEVEVLRADEASEGIAAPSASLGGSATRAGGVAISPASPVSQASPTAGPRARGTQVGLVARACLVRVRKGPCERDTGDVGARDLAASDLVAGTPDPLADMFHHRDVVRDVGRRLGQRLARHVLGEPTADDEGLGREP